MGQIWAGQGEERRRQNTPHNTLISLYTVLYGVQDRSFTLPFRFARGEIMRFTRKRILGFAKSVPLQPRLPDSTAIGSPFHFFHPFHPLTQSNCNVLPQRTYVNYSQNYDLGNSCSNPVIPTVSRLSVSPMYNHTANTNRTFVLLSVYARCYHAFTVNLWKWWLQRVKVNMVFNIR